MNQESTSTDASSKRKQEKATRRLDIALKVVPICLSVIALIFSTMTYLRTSSQNKASAASSAREKLAFARESLHFGENAFQRDPGPEDHAGFRRAEDALNEVYALLSKNPDRSLSTQYHVYQAALQFRRQPRSEAYRHLELARKLSPMDADVAYAEGLFRHLEATDPLPGTSEAEIEHYFELAQQCYERALKNPGKLEFHLLHNLGVIAMDKGDYHTAIKHLDLASKRRDYEEETFFHLGAAFLETRYSKDSMYRSIDASSRAIELNPRRGSTFYHRALARSSLIQNDCIISEYKEAEADFNNAIGIYRAGTLAGHVADIRRSREDLADAQGDLLELKRREAACKASPLKPRA